MPARRARMTLVIRVRTGTSISMNINVLWQKRGLGEGPHGGQRCLPGISCPVVGPDAALLGVDQSRLAQDAEMVADRGLILRKLSGDIADAERLRLLDQEV